MHDETDANQDVGDRPLLACRSSQPASALEAEEPPQDRPCPDPSWWDWRWQLRNRIRDVRHLRRVFPHLSPADASEEAAACFPMAITPYYASLIRKPDLTDPVFLMAVPQAAELVSPAYLNDDPLHEEEDSPVPGLVHRYRDRGLIVATTTCSVYCRHCTRKRVASQAESALTRRTIGRIVGYLRSHPEISDVIISGGDPFTLPTARLEEILAAIRSVPSVEVVRVGTRTPVVLPMRITDELVSMLRRYHPLYVNTHFNHPAELTPAAAEACGRLADAGIPVGNQSVLLRGVNDNAYVLEALFRGLVKARVRPYYLFQCDLVRGVEHFRTRLSRGLEIMEYLRGRLSGLAIPNFVVDTPAGGGKIPLLPNYVVCTSPTHTVLRNFEGMFVSYPEPSHAESPQQLAESQPAGGIWDLATGWAASLRPAGARPRRKRALKRSVSEGPIAKR